MDRAEKKLQCRNNVQSAQSRKIEKKKITQGGVPETSREGNGEGQENDTAAPHYDCCVPIDQPLQRKQRNSWPPIGVEAEGRRAPLELDWFGDRGCVCFQRGPGDYGG